MCVILSVCIEYKQDIIIKENNNNNLTNNNFWGPENIVIVYVFWLLLSNVQYICLFDRL